jgi:transposase
MLDKFYLAFGGAFLLSKYSYEEKLEAVLRVVEEGMGCRTSAKIMGVSHSMVERWVSRYREFGPEGILMKHGTYDGAFKVHVIEYMHENHLSLCQTAIKFGIPQETTVGKWERIYYEEGPQGLYRDNRGRKSKMSSDKPQKKKISKETEEDLIAEVQRLRMENEYLKKLNALVQERIARENGKEPPSLMN